jgi:hypothetical protein
MEKNMRLLVIKTIALVVAALSLAPSFAHALESYPRLTIWSPELWRDATVFNAQFWLFAVIGAPIDILAILVPAGLTILVRGMRPQFALTLGATLCFALGLAIWFAVVATANSVLATWTPGLIPADFDAVRRQWEFGHLAIAGVKLVAFALLALACAWPQNARDGG